MDKYGRKDGWEMMRELADAESENINDMKSLLAKARDEWLLSEEGKRCCEDTATGKWLHNRLELAFLAGAKYSDERIKQLEVGIDLYITLLRKEQFTPPEVFEKISKITGVEYKAGHSISAIIRDLEQVLKSE